MKELDVAGYDTSTHKYATPSVPLKLEFVQVCQTSPCGSGRQEQCREIKKAQEKEPEAAKEYAIYQSVDVAAQRTFRQRAKSCSKTGTCADNLEDMIQAVNANMEKTRLDLFILGKISTVMLKSKERAQTERKRQRCNYTH